MYPILMPNYRSVSLRDMMQLHRFDPVQNGLEEGALVKSEYIDIDPLPT